MNKSPYYTMKVVRRAQALRKAGWSLRKIPTLLERELGVRPSYSAVRYWTMSETQRERTKLVNRRSKAKAQIRKPYPVGEEYKLAVMRELRERGVPFRQISKVSAVFFGEEIPPSTLERRLGKVAA